MNIIVDRYRIDTIVLMCFFFFFAKKTLIWQCKAYEIIGMPRGQNAWRSSQLSYIIIIFQLPSVFLQYNRQYTPWKYGYIACILLWSCRRLIVPHCRPWVSVLSASLSLWSCWPVIESYLCHTDVPLSQATVTALVRASATVNESSDRSIVTITPPATRRIL